MSTTQVDRSRISLAAAISLTLWSAQLAAQDSVPTGLEEVVVTGSFLRGAPEDSAIPVEIVSYDEIQKMGRPSNLDLVKLMSESGGVAQNTATLAGQKVDDLFNMDLIYRVRLPAQIAATLTVGNVFDKDPSFYRATIPYNTAYGSPLGRTFKFGVTKRF